ncbi:MAG: MBL fold metallo-hydrolase, partial [Cyanobacteria bacterium J06629_2]
MKFVKQGLAALLGVSIAGISSVTVAQDQDFSQVEIETIPVAENIYMLVGEGGNIGVSAGEDGVLLIDDQYAPLIEKIKAAVGEI